MKRFIQLLFLVALSMYNAIQTVTGGATLKKLAPSGVINQGILGGFSGKVGPVVGGKWKDIDYMRSYVIPANPNTTDQQAVRAKFAALVATGRALLATILQPFWDPFYSNMSGFNAWISQNYALSDSDGVIDRTAVMSKGTLETAAIISAVKSGTDLDIDWDASPDGNGLDTDLIVAMAFDVTTGILYTSVGVQSRSDGSVTLTIPTGTLVANIFAYTFAYRGVGSELVVSDSTGANVTGS